MKGERAGKRPTLKDVAALAGVSLKTASNVKNQWPYVSDVTREKVLRAMDTLGYRPSRIARSLVTGRSETIGVVVPDLANPFFSAVVRGCEDALLEQGYGLLLCSTMENREREAYVIDLLANHGVDGLILWTLGSGSDTLRKAIPHDVPIVSVDGMAQQAMPNLTVIDIENETGALAAVEHLIDLGRRRIAFLDSSFDRRPARARLGGYRLALAKHDLGVDERLIVAKAPTIGGGYLGAQKLLTMPAVDAIFCFNDLMCLGALAAARSKDRAVPDDVALVGFDDVATTVLVSPAITTVHIDQHRLGVTAVQALMSRIREKRDEFKRMTFDVALTVRESCGARELSSDEKQRLLAQLAVSDQVNLPSNLENAGAGWRRRAV